MMDRHGVAVVIQARMGSSRLPGKTLEPLGDRAVLDWVVERCALSRAVDDVIVATSSNAEDDAIEAHLSGRPVVLVRGSADDVLSRFGVALDQTNADWIVRVTADCPLVQPELIDAGVRIAIEAGVDYVATGLDGRMPRGFDLEVVARSALETALHESDDPVEREHVTVFIVRRPERFPAAPLTAPTWARRTDLRLTVDESVDLEMIRQLVDGLGLAPHEVSGQAIVQFLDAHPEIAAINRHVEHRIVT